jgi:phage terminase large subunit-like protein
MRCVAIDFPTYVQEILGPEYVNWATVAELKAIEYDNEKKRKITWKNKSKLSFMTYIQPYKTHGGAAVDRAHFDEEPTKEHYQENIMRLVSTKGHAICGMTALEGVTWTEEIIFKPAEKGDSKYYSMEMSTYDNPINDEDVVNEVLDLCVSQADVQIRVYGKRVPRGGHIFEQWREAHPFLIERFQIPQEGGMLGRIIDPHPQLPHAISWIWIDINHITNTDSFEKATGFRYPPFNNLPYMFVCAELSEKGSATMLASYIDIMEDKIGRKADITICDPRGWQISQEDENAKSLVEQLNDVGIYPIKGSKKLMGSEKNVGGLVKLKECVSLEFKVAKNMSGAMETVTKDFPQLMIFSDLNHHRFEYANYRWQPPPMTRAGESKEAPQKPIDKDDHFIENDRRFVEWARDQQFVIFDTPEYDAKLRYKSGDVEIEVNFEEEENMLIGA